MRSLLRWSSALLTRVFSSRAPAAQARRSCTVAFAPYYRAAGKVVLCVASSGIAALLLDGGRTAHSRFKIPIEITEESTCNVRKNTDLAALLLRTSLVVWDEVPMQHKHCFEAVYRTLRDICESTAPFGGKPVVFGGDFAQILPVVPGGDRPQVVQACLQMSTLWPSFRKLFLTENMRVRSASPENVAFVQWLRDLSYDDANHGLVAPPPAAGRSVTIELLIREIYPQGLLARALDDFDMFRDRAILTVRNTAVADINVDVLKGFPGAAKVYLSANSVDLSPDDADNPAVQFAIFGGLLAVTEPFASS